VQLIDDLLDVSQILQGTLSLEVTSVSLSTIILAAVDAVQSAVTTKEIQLNLQLAPESYRVSGDAVRLQQVMSNLLSNAVKFTPLGGSISVELSYADAAAKIQVRDTGKGIKADFIPYLFDHFRQEDGSITRRFGGLGLGLAITRQIIKLHGGSITATSPGENQGATFMIQLPLAGEGNPS
jgi:signal transduction histidine kinase